MALNTCNVALITIRLVCISAAASAQTLEVEPGASDDARPTASQRFHRLLLDAAGPVALLEDAAWAGVAHAKNFPPEWGPGAHGYGKRFASVFAQGVIQESVTYGLSEALAADSRFHKSRKRGFWSRAGDAVGQAFMTRTSEGRLRVSVPLIGGYASGGMALIAWYPARYDYKDGLGFGSAALASRAVVNVIHEFVVP
jgi:hypothetical protein